MLINSPNISGSLNVSGNTVITGSLTTSIAALNTPATTFLTSNNGTIRSRTAAQTLSDIGAQATGSYVTIATASGSYVTIATDQSITGVKTFTKDIIVNGINIGLGAGNIDTNTRVGTAALLSNTTGFFNVALGRNASTSNTTGNSNTSLGYNALYSGATASFNTAVGALALESITSGGNVAVGNAAGRLTTANAINTTSTNSIYIGNDSSPSASGNTNEIIIGHGADGSGSNTVTIGNSSITDNYLKGNVRATTFHIAAAGTASPTIIRNTSGTTGSTGGHNTIGFNSNNNIFVDTTNSGGFILSFNNSVANRTYTLKDASGTLAFTSDIPTVAGSYLPLTGGAITGSLIVTGGITGNVTGSATTSSYVEYSNVANKPTLLSGSAQIRDFGIFATTGSNQFNGSQSITGSLTVSGQVVAQTLNVQQVTSSIVYSSGSNIFGNDVSNTQQFTGSVNITGSLTTSIAPLGSAATTFLTSNGGTIRSRTAAQTLSDIGGQATGSYVTVSTNQSITGQKTFTKNIDVNGVYVGRGASGGDLFAGIAGNTAIGSQALLSISTGYPNTAVGSEALRNITTGANNIAVGSTAGKLISAGTANETSTTSIYIGNDTRPSANGNTNEIVIGHTTTGNGSNTVTIGNSSITNTYLKGAVTLTGALSGTSAAFTSTGNAVTITTNSSASNVQLKVNNGSSGDIYAGVAASDGSSVFTGTTAYSGYIGTNQAVPFYIVAGGVARVTISSTGAATFSSSVTATSGNFTVDGVATNSVLDILTLSHTTSGTAASGLGAGILFKSERPSGGVNLSRAAIYGVSGSDPDDDGDLTFYTRTDTSGAGFTEKMRINSDGNVLVGATNADVGGSVKGAAIRQNGSIVGATNISSPAHYQSPISADRMNTMGDGVMYGMWRQGIFQAGIGATNASVMTFFTGNNDSMTERMRISAGNVEVRAAGELRVYRSDNARYGTFYTDNNYVHIAASVDPIKISSPERTEFYTAGVERMRITSTGNVVFNGDDANGWYAGFSNSSTNFAYMGATTQFANSGGSSTDFGIRSANALAFYTSGGNERMRITSGGDVLLGASSFPAGERMMIQKTEAAPLGLDRRGSDGGILRFYHDGAEEGNVTTSGTTVSYNGGHLSRYSQTLTNTRIEGLVKGTVMSNLDQMAEWINPETDEPYPNEQLNCMKISDIEGDPNVAGVFVNWDNDDQTSTNDMNIAMTGDMIIRISQDVIVQRGDLLISAGDGTAKPQSDDIIRNSTIAKVTSAHVTCTYEDGSYCIPCVLMAC